jgi:hypothetical protein
LNDGIALAGRKQSAQYVAFPWSSQYVFAQRLQALVAGCSQEKQFITSSGSVPRFAREVDSWPQQT